MNNNLSLSKITYTKQRNNYNIFYFDPSKTILKLLVKGQVENVNENPRTNSRYVILKMNSSDENIIREIDNNTIERLQIDKNYFRSSVYNGTCNLRIPVRYNKVETEVSHENGELMTTSEIKIGDKVECVIQPKNIWFVENPKTLSGMVINLLSCKIMR